nr:uncharacterized protein LOC133601292 [Nerophis lumbriciformis]
MLWRPRTGFFLLERHLQRLLGSARYFGFTADLPGLRTALAATAKELPAATHTIRLLVDSNGQHEISAEPFAVQSQRPWTVTLDDRPVMSEDPFLRTRPPIAKLTTRPASVGPRSTRVALWNEREELTEGTHTNLALEIDGEWLTPAANSGLLQGTYRQELIERGRLREAVLPREMIYSANRVRLINSVRGWIRAARTKRTA